MINVSILSLNQALLVGIAVYADLFKLAGAVWNKSTGFGLKKLFNVEVVSENLNSLGYSNNLTIQPDRAVDEAMDSDLIIVPSSGFDSNLFGPYPSAIIDWLKCHHEKGTKIAASCTGVFVLAESGILNGKIATTHWAYVEMFKKRYPDIILSPNKIITEDKKVICSGGGSAGMDMCLYIIEQYYGRKVANRCAKIFLLERGRNSQSPYVISHIKKNHQDEQIIQVQNQIENNFDKDIKVNDLATYIGMSLRNFKRRFKNATGESPLVYIQKYRMEAAKIILENHSSGIEEIANKVGYDDVGFFRKLFTRHVGLSPSLYRQKFRHSEIMN